MKHLNVGGNTEILRLPHNCLDDGLSSLILDDVYCLCGRRKPIESTGQRTTPLSQEESKTYVMQWLAFF